MLDTHARTFKTGGQEGELLKQVGSDVIYITLAGREGTFYLASDDSLYGADNWTAANMGIFCRFGFVSIPGTVVFVE